jgi:hypothetical protein
MVETEENGLNEVIHFNFDKMYTYLGQDRESIRKVLLAVLDELKQTVRMFEECIINRRLKEIRETAHRLVETTASVGLDRLCETLQRIAQSNKFDPIALDRNFNSLKMEISLINKLVNRYLLEK